MIGIFNTIKLNNNEIFRPSDFSLQREQIYAAEYETCTGKRVSDVVGWRYSDMTLNFDTLPQAQLEVLLGLSGEVTMTFIDEEGNEVTENVIPKVLAMTATRYTDSGGSAVWRGIGLGVQFIDAHN